MESWVALVAQAVSRITNKGGGMTKFYTEDMGNLEEMAERHVDWLLDLISPIIRKIAVAEFIHGYKHGTKARPEIKLKEEGGNER